MASLAQLSVAPPATASRVTTGALHKLTFPALGTTCEVQYAPPAPGQPRPDFELAAVSWVQAFEAKYSRFKSTSLVSRINAAAGISWVEVDAEMEELFQLCDNLHVMTQGVLDPTALPLIQLWNWKAEIPVVPSATQIGAAQRLTGWTKVRRAPGRVFLPERGMALDFGGFGKEYAVDIVAQIASNHGLTNVLVDFGHDLRALGVPPGRPAWHIGLEDPQQPGRTAGSVAISGQGVASSGDYVRCFKVGNRRYGHIIDPRTGCPVDNGCTQATVLAGSCLQAGVLSTTAFVLGLTEGLNFIRSFPGAEGIMVSDTRRAQTPGFFHYAVST
ncbi:MAG: ApbE family lipoprotein [Lacunisphaera sp.]|nr:ApbE family lipoprotein [Lacunisphaera sp.]